MSTVITICNQKGGVAKTATTVNLSAALSNIGKRILVLDVDPQANASSTLSPTSPYESKFTMCDVFLTSTKLLATSYHPTKVKNIDIVVGHIKLAGIEKELRNRYKPAEVLKLKIDEETKNTFDFIIIDTPPALSLLTVNALSSSDYYIIPIQSDSYYALEGIEQLQKTVAEVKEELNPDLALLGVLITLYDKRTKLCNEMSTEIRHAFGKDNVFKTLIHSNTLMARSALNKETIYMTDGRAPTAQDYTELAEEIMAKLDTKQAIKALNSELRSKIKPVVEELILGGNKNE